MRTRRAMILAILWAAMTSASASVSADLFKDIKKGIEHVGRETGKVANKVTKETTKSVGNAIGGDVGKEIKKAGEAVGKATEDIAIVTTSAAADITVESTKVAIEAVPVMFGVMASIPPMEESESESEESQDKESNSDDVSEEEEDAEDAFADEMLRFLLGHEAYTRYQQQEVAAAELMAAREAGHALSPLSFENQSLESTGYTAVEVEGKRPFRVTSTYRPIESSRAHGENRAIDISSKQASPQLRHEEARRWSQKLKDRLGPGKGRVVVEEYRPHVGEGPRVLVHTTYQDGERGKIKVFTRPEDQKASATHTHGQINSKDPLPRN